MPNDFSRRRFLSAAAVTGVAARGSTARPAALGGAPVRTEPFPAWPVYEATEEQALLSTLRSGGWFRGNGRAVSQFEESYARMTGSKYCLATANGTSALIG